jgi:hypothetical protein
MGLGLLLIGLILTMTILQLAPKTLPSRWLISIRLSASQNAAARKSARGACRSSGSGEVYFDQVGRCREKSMRGEDGCELERRLLQMSLPILSNPFILLPPALMIPLPTARQPSIPSGIAARQTASSSTKYLFR